VRLAGTQVCKEGDKFMPGTQNSPVKFMYKNWTLPFLATVYAGNFSIDSPHSSA